jgi:hypothetical protein
VAPGEHLESNNLFLADTTDYIHLPLVISNTISVTNSASGAHKILLDLTRHQCLNCYLYTIVILLTCLRMVIDQAFDRDKLREEGEIRPGMARPYSCGSSKFRLSVARKAIEEEIRTGKGQNKWRCAAVIRDARNTERIRIACKDELDLQRVKEAAQRTAMEGLAGAARSALPCKGRQCELGARCGLVWKQLLPVVKERVLLLFQTSLDDGELPIQWRNARIIPLKQPNKA